MEMPTSWKYVVTALTTSLLDMTEEVQEAAGIKYH